MVESCRKSNGAAKIDSRRIEMCLNIDFVAISRLHGKTSKVQQLFRHF